MHQSHRRPTYRRLIEMFDPLVDLEVGSKGKTSRGVSRRTVLKVGAAAGGGLLLSVGLPYSAGSAADDANFAPNAFVRIARDGQVTLTMSQVEMGQGTYTSMPMLVAEELEVDLAQIRLEHAPPDDKLYGNPRLGFQVTGGSTSVRAFWKPLRIAGAAARTMLISAAAATWNVEIASCHAAKGTVIHAPSGRKLTYGRLVDQAAKLPVPNDVVLKDRKDFTLILLSQKVAAVAAENQIIEEIQILARGGPDESQAQRRRRSAICGVC